MFCNQTESRWPSERFQDRSNERHRRKADGEEEDRENEDFIATRRHKARIDHQPKLAMKLRNPTGY